VSSYRAVRQPDAGRAGGCQCLGPVSPVYSIVNEIFIITSFANVFIITKTTTTTTTIMIALYREKLRVVCGIAKGSCPFVRLSVCL